MALKTASLVRVTGRVITVRPLEDGTMFAVSIGPPPDLFWFRTHTPPKLGYRLRVTGTVVESSEIGAGTLTGTVTQLGSTKVEVVPEQYASRFVPPAWVERAKSVMDRPLYDYQALGAGWLASRIAAGTGAILGDDPGLGKSAQAVAALCATSALPAVVVCPNSLKPHWVREFVYAMNPPEVFVISGQHGPLRPADVFIINYELLRYREEQLKALKPRLYIFDEAQALKNPGARGFHRAAVASRLVSRTPGAVMLSGTPIENRPAELWRILHLAEPKKWPSFPEYQRRYCQPRKGKEVGRAVRTSAGKVERLDELHAAVDPIMLRRLKHQVLADLPSKSRHITLVRIGMVEMTHYNRAKRDVVQWLRDIGQGKRALNASRAESLTQLTMLRRIAAIGKLRSVVPDYLKTWFSRNASEPLVIFGYHRDVMLGLWTLCRRMGLRVAGIGGGESSQKRQHQVDSFQEGLADVFLAPIMTAGVGLNLQRASEALFIERIWTPSGMTQAEDRIHRIGQTRPVTITYLDAEGTVDEHIATVLEAKQRLINAVVDDGAEALSVVDEVIERMKLED